jgi:thioredoxin 1
MKRPGGRESRGLLDHLNEKAQNRFSAGDAPQGEDMSDTIQAVTDASFQADVIEASKTQPVMVDFWADWCRPCHMLTPTVEEVAREHAGKVKVVKLNIDDNMNVPGKFNIRGIPTLLVFKGGQVADQIVGAVPKEQIVKVLERHIS